MALDRDYGRATPDTDVRKRKGTPNADLAKRAKVESFSDVELEEETPDQIAKQYKKYEYAPKYDLNSEELFCVCRKTDNGELMIMCDGCDSWFHFKCMKLNKKNANLVSKFYCKFCKWKEVGSTRWKRKCRLEYCYEPIRPNSKYCCDDHGIFYMRQNLLEKNYNGKGITSSMVQTILTRVNDNFDTLKNLGTAFPELPEVKQFKLDGTGSIPDSIKTNLNLINSRLKILEVQMELYNLRTNSLIEIKDKIKLINEKLSKDKRVEICCYDKNIELGDVLLYEEILHQSFTEFEDQIDEDSVWFKDRICTKDKKRCIRHNGWWNLINDEFSKKLTQLEIDLEILKDEREDVFRDYSIKIYESTSETPEEDAGVLKAESKDSLAGNEDSTTFEIDSVEKDELKHAKPSTEEVTSAEGIVSTKDNVPTLEEEFTNENSESIVEKIDSTVKKDVSPQNVDTKAHSSEDLGPEIPADKPAIPNNTLLDTELTSVFSGTSKVIDVNTELNIVPSKALALEATV